MRSGSPVVLASFLGTLAMAGCGASTTSPPSSASPASPGGSQAQPPGGQATGLGGARPLPAGARVELDIPCEGAIYVGPFEPRTEGETIALTSEHVEVEQTCPGGSWVDGTDAFVAVANLGCSDSGAPARGELVYRYAPAAGEASATPVYLKLTRGDQGPAACTPIHVVLVRTQ